MRILIGAGNYPKLSESYIEAEIEFLLRRGMEVAVYSKVVGSGDAPEQVRVFRGPVQEAIREWSPRVFHAHYLTFDAGVLEAVGAAGIPVTVRGHSFDFGVDAAVAVADRPYVRKVWLFPHFAVLVRHPKVAPLQVAFDETLYSRSSKKDRRLVYRTGAGKHGKGLPDFFDIATRCPSHRFKMTANVVIGAESYLQLLRRVAAQAKVEYLEDVQRAAAVACMQEAGIYLDTSDPKGHPFGMPISIAEAMATGCYVLVRSGRAAEHYLNGAGAVYSSVEEAAALIQDTLTWSDRDWDLAADYAVEASFQFRSDRVLEDEIAFWSTL